MHTRLDIYVYLINQTYKIKKIWQRENELMLLMCISHAFLESKM